MFFMTIMLFISMMIPTIIMLLNFLLQKKKSLDREKMTPFECGFDPMCPPRLPISIHFYLICMIFLIFDVEIILLMPLMPAFFTMNFYTWMSTTLFFIFILLSGLYLEWYDGALKWLK